MKGQSSVNAEGSSITNMDETFVTVSLGEGRCSAFREIETHSTVTKSFCPIRTLKFVILVTDMWKSHSTLQITQSQEHNQFSKYVH